MNEFDDLDRLERECGPVLRVALRRVAEEIPVDTSAWQPGPTVRFLNGEHAPLDEREAHTTSAGDPPREWFPRRRWMQVAAATIVAFAIGLLALIRDQGQDSVQPGAFSESVFAMTSPSAEEEAQATNDDLYRDGDVGTQVSATGNSVSLRTCRDSASATCGTDWAYVTVVAGGGEVHGGLLGEASPVNLHLQLLDDRYFVASESSPDAQAPARAWLIDAVSGRAGSLRWRDVPTTLNSPEQRLLLCGESYSSLATHCAVFRGPDAADGGWQFAPSDAGLAKVVNIRDGTIRPLAMPDSAVAGLPVAQHGSGRIWIGTDPDDDRLGLAYSDDGGATWNEVALPEQVSATSEELTTSLLPYGDDLLEIAADGDRVAVAESWEGDDNTVYVSNNAGTTWTTAASEPTGNGVHLYVLADRRLVVMGSMDPYPSQVLASTGSDWTELESVSVEFAAEPGSLTDLRFSVNRAGVAMIHSYIDEADSSTLDTIDFSTDLTNWSTIQIRNP
ncbi:MAG: sialidase family protein [Ilumatobacteraceae bacterium]